MKVINGYTFIKYLPYGRYWRYKDDQDLILDLFITFRDRWTCEQMSVEGGGGSVMEIPKSGVRHEILPRFFTVHLTH